MKISYIPMHTQADIFFPLASVTRLSAEWRIGVIQTLVQLGHEVEVCGRVEKLQRTVLTLIQEGNFEEAMQILPDAGDYAFYTQVKFNEDGYPTDPDIILVEGGTTNSFHTRKLGDQVLPIQQYAYEAISRHKGRVFWFCPEPNYAFRFNDLNLPTGNAAPATDLRRLLHSSGRFVRDKQFVWLTTDHNTEEFIKRSGIPKDSVTFFAPYSLAVPELCAPTLPIKPIEELEWDVVYIGHLAGAAEQKRRDQLSRILSGAKTFGIRAATYGDRDEGWEIPGVQHFPRTANMGEARGILNKSMFTPLVIRHDFIQTQHESNRQSQAVQCGCLPIWPEEVKWMGILNKVNNPTELFGLIAGMKVVPGFRESRIENARKLLPRFNEWLPELLKLEGMPIEDVWKKDLEPFTEESSQISML